MAIPLVTTGTDPREVVPRPGEVALAGPDGRTSVWRADVDWAAVTGALVPALRPRRPVLA